MDLIDALSDLCNQTDQPIIAIDGPAGAGKSTLASDLQIALHPRFTSTIIHMDDLYDGWENALGEHLTQTLQSIVRAHKSRQEILLSHFDWTNYSFRAPVKVPTCELLILEGVGCGQSAIRKQLSALIWMEIESTQGLDRVLGRDGEQIRNQMEKWLITQEQHFQHEGTDKAADFIMTT